METKNASTSTKYIAAEFMGNVNYDVLMSESNTRIRNYRKSLCIRTCIRRDGTILAQYVVSWAARDGKRVMVECVTTFDVLDQAVEQYMLIS